MGAQRNGRRKSERVLRSVVNIFADTLTMEQAADIMIDNMSESWTFAPLRRA